MDFTHAKIKFSYDHEKKSVIQKSLCTVDGKFIEQIKIRDVHGQPNEEFYKWQFINE